MELKDRLKVGAEKSAWVKFRGIEVLVKYKDRVELNKLIDKAKQIGWRRHVQVEEIDDEVLLRQTATLIEDWKLTLGQLSQLMDIEVASDETENEVTCSPDNKVMILEHVYDFDEFLLNTVTDLQIFRAAEKEDELKNSETSRDPASE